MKRSTVAGLILSLAAMPAMSASVNENKIAQQAVQGGIRYMGTMVEYLNANGCGTQVKMAVLNNGLKTAYAKKKIFTMLKLVNAAVIDLEMDILDCESDMEDVPEPEEIDTTVLEQSSE